MVHPAALLPAKDTWLAPGFLSSSLCPGLAFQWAARMSLPKIFLRKGQVTSSHLCQYLCFLFNPSVFDLEKSAQLNLQSGTWVTLAHLDKATEPKESLGLPESDVSRRILFKALWSVIEFTMVERGFGFSCFLGFTTHMWFLAKADSWCTAWQRERKAEIGFGLKTAFLLFGFLGFYCPVLLFAFQCDLCEQVPAAKSLVHGLRTTSPR